MNFIISNNRLIILISSPGSILLMPVTSTPVLIKFVIKMSPFVCSLVSLFLQFPLNLIIRNVWLILINIKPMRVQLSWSRRWPSSSSLPLSMSHPALIRETINIVVAIEHVLAGPVHVVKVNIIEPLISVVSVSCIFYLSQQVSSAACHVVCLFRNFVGVLKHFIQMLRISLTILIFCTLGR